MFHSVAVTFSAAYLKIFSADPKLGFLSGADDYTQRAAKLADAVEAAALTCQAANWRFDALVALCFVVLVFLIVAGSAWVWWKLLRGTKRVVLQESEFIPLSRAESSGV